MQGSIRSPTAPRDCEERGLQASQPARFTQLVLSAIEQREVEPFYVMLMPELKNLLSACTHRRCRGEATERSRLAEPSEGGSVAHATKRARPSDAPCA